MTTKDLQGKRLGILGLGVENYFLVKWLIKHRLPCQITICDQRSMEALGDKFHELNKHQHITWQLGQAYNQQLDRYDLLFRSPGWPLSCSGLRQAQRLNAKLIISSPMKLFFDLCPTKNLIGVTGTKGKGTTSSLITAILKADRRKVWLGGNIGIAPFSFLDRLSADDWVVLELSSFQLEDLHRGPRIAVFTNFSPEHLAPADPSNPNFHGSLSEYWRAKFNLLKWQNRSDALIINERLKTRLLKWEQSQGQLRQRVIYFGRSALKTKLPGEHNQENIAAAEAVAKLAKVSPAVTAKAVAAFRGLEHRLEKIATVAAVDYYDDSFATTPEATITALKAFDRPIVLLAGGADKGADFQALAKQAVGRVKYVCLLKGAATGRLKQAFLSAGFNAKQLKEFSQLAPAVAQAQRQAKTGDIVLLSTACASFGMFANYKERGRLFKQAVAAL